ncbi:MAG: dihydroorotase [Synergistaceae bacterium]|jgi:dihydroorotase|nr:dihydroorotase [Synergistaceae bacterium]
MKENKFLIKGGHVVTPEGIKDCGVLVENGKISALAANIEPEGARVINAEGMYVSPGLVDIHCHLREPGYEEKEDIASGTAAAARGGFTSICCMANTNPVNDNAVVTEFIKKKAAMAGPVHVYPIAAITKGLEGEELTEAGELSESGAVGLSDDGRCVKNAQIMRLALCYAKRFGIRIISHPEDMDLVNGGLMNEGYWSTVLGMPGITRAAEESMIARDCLLAEIENTGVHIAHVSTAGGAEIIRAAKKRGVAVTCETTPHYIYATDEWVKTYDTFTKVNPPLRTENDRHAIIEALLDGTIDCIATDHAPHHTDDKNVEYAIAANGISGFETAFAICWTVLVKGGLMTPEELFAKMTSEAANILNLDAGVIGEGRTADIAIISPDEKWTVNPSKFASRGHNSPFGGHELTGVVKCAIAGGEIAHGGDWACG